MARVRKDKSSFIWSWCHVYRFFSIFCNFLQGNSRNSLYMKIRDVSCMILPQNYNCTTKTPLLSKYAYYDVKHFPMLGAPSFLACPSILTKQKKSSVFLGSSGRAKELLQKVEDLQRNRQRWEKLFLGCQS